MMKKVVRLVLVAVAMSAVCHESEATVAARPNAHEAVAATVLNKLMSAARELGCEGAEVAPSLTEGTTEFLNELKSSIENRIEKAASDKLDAASDQLTAIMSNQTPEHSLVPPYREILERVRRNARTLSRKIRDEQNNRLKRDAETRRQAEEVARKVAEELGDTSLDTPTPASKVPAPDPPPKPTQDEIDRSERHNTVIPTGQLARSNGPAELGREISQRVGWLQFELNRTPEDKHDAIIRNQVVSALSAAREQTPSQKRIAEVEQTFREELAAAEQNPDRTEPDIVKIKEVLDRERTTIKQTITNCLMYRTDDEESTYADIAKSVLGSGPTLHQLTRAIEIIKSEFPPPFGASAHRQLRARVDNQRGIIQYVLSQVPADMHQEVIRRAAKQMLQTIGRHQSPPEHVTDAMRIVQLGAATAEQNPDRAELDMSRFQEELSEWKKAIEQTMAEEGGDVIDRENRYAAWGTHLLQKMELPGPYRLYHVDKAAEAIKEKVPPPGHVEARIRRVEDRLTDKRLQMRRAAASTATPKPAAAPKPATAPRQPPKCLQRLQLGNTVSGALGRRIHEAARYALDIANNKQPKLNPSILVFPLFENEGIPFTGKVKTVPPPHADTTDRIAILANGSTPTIITAKPESDQPLLSDEGDWCSHHNQLAVYKVTSEGRVLTVTVTDDVMQLFEAVQQGCMDMRIKYPVE
ncbi:MAG: hypothetical protein LBJ69_00870 [Holosporales bacterium]|nr:hypothetical protein [Holosporales bacterium]